MLPHRRRRTRDMQRDVKGMRSLTLALKRLFRRYPFLRLVLFIVILWAAGAVFLRFSEGANNPEFDSMPKAMWNIAVYLFSGLDSGIPQTGLGKIAVTVVLVLSLGVVAVLTGSIASFLVERRLGRRRKMPSYDLKGHIVICNWNDKGIPIIRELHAEIVKDRRPVVILSERADAGQLPEDGDLPEFQDVYLVKGDPASEVMLRRANVQFAYSAVVLADPADGNLADAKSILIAMAVRSVCSDAGVPKTYVCVEGVAPQNVDHLQRAGADEIVSASDFAMMLLSQSALSHGLGTVYRDLLTVSGETNEIYILPIPEDFIGKSFSELGAAMFRNRDPQNPVILIGAVRDEGILVNPQAEKLPAFSEGDKAVVIAFERPSSLV